MNMVDKNGLLLSNNSDSGYMYVTTLFDGPLEGKFIAFAKVPEYLRDARSQFGASFDGSSAAFGYNDTLTLGIFDDVRDAAFIGQHFNGNSVEDKNDNLERLFAGLYGKLPKTPNWSHDPNYQQMESARQRSIKRAASRAKIDIQKTLSAFHQEHGAEYNVKPTDAKAIRAFMNAYLGTIEKPKQADAIEAARLAFEPYKKT